MQLNWNDLFMGFSFRYLAKCVCVYGIWVNWNRWWWRPFYVTLCPVPHTGRISLRNCIVNGFINWKHKYTFRYGIIDNLWWMHTGLQCESTWLLQHVCMNATNACLLLVVLVPHECSLQLIQNNENHSKHNVCIISPTLFI